MADGSQVEDLSALRENDHLFIFWEVLSNQLFLICVWDLEENEGKWVKEIHFEIYSIWVMDLSTRTPYLITKLLYNCWKLSNKIECNWFYLILLLCETNTITYLS